MPLCSTKAVKLFNECDVLTQNYTNNIVLPISKGSQDKSNLKVFTLAKHRFPQTDVIDPSYDSTQYTKMQVLENILNVSVCNLNSTNYQFWS